MTEAKQKRIESILVCPQCHKGLEFTPSQAKCSKCDAAYPIRDGKYFFVKDVFEDSKTESFLDRLKSRYKKYPKMYDFLVKVVSPVHFRMNLIADFIRVHDTIINVGSGNQVLDPKVINCDVFPYDHVDVVVDAAILPFKTESVDGVVNIAVLEHVPNPATIVDEMQRILKVEGGVFSVIPFMQPYHASPADYHRFTKTGIIHLHKNFQQKECAVFSGPVSGIFMDGIRILCNSIVFWLSFYS